MDSSGAERAWEASGGACSRYPAAACNTVRAMALSLGKLLLTKLASVVAVVVGTTGLTWLIVNALRPDLRAGDDRSLFVALADYLESAFLHLDFSSSTTASNREVETLIRQGLPVDLSLLAGGLAVGLIGGIAGGALCAARPGTLPARVLDALAVLFICTPVYVVGLALLLSFGAGVGFVHSGIVPMSYVPFAESPTRWAGSLLAPWFVLGLPLAGACLRLMRSSMLETLDEDYVRTAVAKGLRRRRVVGHHALRPALPPVVALTTVSMPVVVTNLVLIEQVFTVPGVFTGMRRGIQAGDFDLLFALTAVAAGLVALASAVTDLVLAWVNPRVRARA